MLSAASGEGNRAVLLGSSTGRDGIGGASILASSGFAEGAEAKRPSVQIGDPFEEKRLIEACLKLYRRGLVVGIQDLGAAGISCATAESAAKGRMGMDVDLDAVHLPRGGHDRRRDPHVGVTGTDAGHRPSRGPGRGGGARHQVGDRRLPIGVVTAGGTLRVRHHGEIVAEVPAASLSEGAPRYERPRRRPDDLDEVWADQPPLPVSVDAAAVLVKLLSDPAVGDPSPVFQQYDHQLFLDTVVEPGHDGSLLRIKDTEKGIAVSTDGDGARGALDARRGAARIVWEAALNVAVTGARPYAMVDNLNLGNPERPEVMWQLVETVAGISAACEDLGIPVVGGNVSFYNETDGADIPPTPVVGMLGLADPRPARPPRLDRAEEGMAIWLVGPEDDADFAASAFARLVLGHRRGRPAAATPRWGAPWWRGQWSWPGGARSSTTSPPEAWRWPWPRSPSAPTSA